MRYFVIYLAAINILTFCVYGADKRRAKISGARRVPEKTLFALALLLGSAGALFAMRVFHHKTRHWYFKFGIPVSCDLHPFVFVVVGSARTEPFSYMAFYHAAGNKGTGKWKIHKFFIFPLRPVSLCFLN